MSVTRNQEEEMAWSAYAETSEAKTDTTTVPEIRTRTKTAVPKNVWRKTPQAQIKKYNDSFTDQILSGSVPRKGYDNQNKAKEEDEAKAAREQKQDNEGIVALCSRNRLIWCSVCCCILIILIGIAVFCLRGGVFGAVDQNTPMADEANVTILTASPSVAGVGEVASLQGLLDETGPQSDAVEELERSIDQGEEIAQNAEKALEQLTEGFGETDSADEANKELSSSAKHRRLQTLNDAEVGAEHLKPSMESTGSKLTSLQSVLSIATVILIVVLQSIYLIYRH